MPNMWSNDRIFYAAGRETLKETEKSPGAVSSDAAAPARPRETLKGLIGRLLDPHLLPEDDGESRSPVSRR